MDDSPINDLNNFKDEITFFDQSLDGNLLNCPFDNTLSILTIILAISSNPPPSALPNLSLITVKNPLSFINCIKV